MMKEFPCACIVGPRQVGKTTLARMAFPRAAYHDLEAPDLRERIRLSPAEFLRSAKRPMILDEIQYLPELWQFLKVEIDSNRSAKGRFLILGSAHPDLVKGASESLAGRIGFVDLNPLVPKETAKGKPSLSAEEIWLKGGYPEAAKAGDSAKHARWMEAYIRTFIERDLPGEGVQADPGLMRKLILMVGNAHGGIWNASQLAASAGVSYHTVNRYLDILDRSFLIRRLPPYFTNIGKRLVKSPKIYIRDSGLYHHLIGIRGMDHLLSSPQCGASWEGFVLEAIIRHASLGEYPVTPFYYRTQRGLEADLVLQSGNSLSVIEVKLGSRLERRWIDSLKSVMEDIGARKGAIIHSGEESFPIEEGIMVHAAKDFRLLDRVLPR
ncbi:MAG TPA: ATP-binding protein [Pirellulaceae bacterium]